VPENRTPHQTNEGNTYMSLEGVRLNEIDFWNGAEEKVSHCVLEKGKVDLA
jgi:hypothetical protein